MHKPAWISLLYAALLLGAPGLALADGASARFSVGLTVLAPGQAVPALRNATFTPGASASVLAGMGYRNIQLVQRGASTYLFRASRKGINASVLITMAAWQGRVIRISLG